MKTDKQIQQDVMDELLWEPSLNAAEIGVAVKDGIVTLSGAVDSYAKKSAAENVAKNVAGVKALAEDIEVKFSGSFKKNDSEIATAIMQALKWNSFVQDEKIKVKVDDGWVTLEGEVEWGFQIARIKSVINDLIGVRGISNLITVRPRVNMKEVKNQILAAFNRHANIDANLITIETVGNKVILTGKVRSLAEKRDAEKAVWSAPGVAIIENNLLVDYSEALASY
jgi:osmotically-inducible protein OsmY